MISLREIEVLATWTKYLPPPLPICIVPAIFCRQERRNSAFVCIVEDTLFAMCLRQWPSPPLQPAPVRSTSTQQPVLVSKTVTSYRSQVRRNLFPMWYVVVANNFRRTFSNAPYPCYLGGSRGRARWSMRPPINIDSAPLEMKPYGFCLRTYPYWYYRERCTSTHRSIRLLLFGYSIMLS